MVAVPYIKTETQESIHHQEEKTNNQLDMSKNRVDNKITPPHPGKAPDSEEVPMLISDNDGNSDCDSLYSKKSQVSPLNMPASQENRAMLSIPDQFKSERNQLMTIIVKYVATKIQNSFPPDFAEASKQFPKELPLDRFLLLITSRLHLNLPLFMKGIIYLFRYMDIIYLLRYLNQSNNTANTMDMGYELKKLIIGCFKLSILREQKLVQLKVSKDYAVVRHNYNWSAITGLPGSEINAIVKNIMGRMNGKLNIKNSELIKLKQEIFRFVKMVAQEV